MPSSERLPPASSDRCVSRSSGTIRLERAYDPPSGESGTRVLVDRLWPRGMRREALRIDRWARELAPSEELRRFFRHDPARWEEFRQRYRAELARPEANRSLRELAEIARNGPLVLVFGARDRLHNQAVVLKEVLEELLVGKGAEATATLTPKARSAADRRRRRHCSRTRADRRSPHPGRGRPRGRASRAGRTLSPLSARAVGPAPRE